MNYQLKKIRFYKNNSLLREIIFILFNGFTIATTTSLPK